MSEMKQEQLSMQLPYENDQPYYVNDIHTPIMLERMPRLAHGGIINEEFCKFFDSVVNCLLKSDIKGLYDLSDKFYEFNQFKEQILKQLRPILVETDWTDARHYLDIEVNVERFQSTFRNILGGLNISGVYVGESKYEDSKASPLVVRPYSTATLTKYSTELLYAYKDDKFVLLSIFKSVTTDNEV